MDIQELDTILTTQSHQELHTTAVRDVQVVALAVVILILCVLLFITGVAASIRD